MKIQLMRHATLIVTLGTKKILVDPMLCKAGEMPPITNSTNHRRNPLVELSVLPTSLFPVAAVLITHMHRDHFDHTATAIIPKDATILCQPDDEAQLQEIGFQNVMKVEDNLIWEGY